MVYICCFGFSLRLGALLTAIYSSVKVGLCLLPVIIYNQDINIEQFLIKIDYNKTIIELIRQEFLWTAVGVLSFFVLYLLACVLLFVGALKCATNLCYPFLILHIIMILIDVFVYSILFKFLMYLAFLSKESQSTASFSSIGAISCLTVAIFVVFYDIYLEICTYSFIDIVRNLRVTTINMPLIYLIKPMNSSTHLYSYSNVGKLYNKAFINN